jgi:3,4-dihydroxy 2-butanone 4-phosphate synthase/GTP cyclohydrolase II
MKINMTLFLTTFIVLLSGCSEALANSFFSPVTCPQQHHRHYPNSLHDRNSDYRKVSSRLHLFRGGSSSELPADEVNTSSSSLPASASSKNTSNKEAKLSKGFMKNNNEVNGVTFSISKVPVSMNNSPSTSSSSIPPNTDQTQIPCNYIAETNLPTDIGHFRLRAYRVNESFQRTLMKNKFMGTEPCVIYCTDKPPFGNDGGVKMVKEVPVRIHDQCFTSEVFRSQRCDCREQLKMSLEYIRQNGGAIIYLQQEGRGIGLANKVAAYELQDGGMDTVDANIHLGFPEDCRQYGVVPSILSDMGIDSIRLITNNPRKINKLKSLGVNVVDTIPMVVKNANEYNRKYLKTKKDRMNHKNFGEMLSLDQDQAIEDVVDNLRLISANKITNGKSVTSLAEDYINDGEEMAAAAVVTALDEGGDWSDIDSKYQAGVLAAADGYCFGRKSVEDAIAAIARGEIVVVVDDMNRENEGDFIMAADLATPETLATIIRYSSGVICIGMEGNRMDELNLPPMCSSNEDPKGTAFSVSVDASKAHGISTGISASDRAKTLQLLGKPTTTASDFVRPGHIFPLRAREGGVLARDGHTEASVDLARLAGRDPSGILCEIVSEENPTEMARLPELKRFCKKHGFVLTSIVDLAQYRRDIENL